MMADKSSTMNERRKNLNVTDECTSASVDSTNNNVLAGILLKRSPIELVFTTVCVLVDK